MLILTEKIKVTWSSKHDRECKSLLCGVNNAGGKMVNFNHKTIANVSKTFNYNKKESYKALNTME